MDNLHFKCLVHLFVGFSAALLYLVSIWYSYPWTWYCWPGPSFVYGGICIPSSFPFIGDVWPCPVFGFCDRVCPGAGVSAHVRVWEHIVQWRYLCAPYRRFSWCGAWREYLTCHPSSALLWRADLDICLCYIFVRLWRWYWWNRIFPFFSICTSYITDFVWHNIIFHPGFLPCFYHLHCGFIWPGVLLCPPQLFGLADLLLPIGRSIQCIG